LRAVIDITPGGESAEAVETRTGKRAWLRERGYHVCEVMVGEVEKDVAAVLERIAQELGPGAQAG
jgi:very-short-patch-repair endonuclease